MNMKSETGCYMMQVETKTRQNNELNFNRKKIVKWKHYKLQYHPKKVVKRQHVNLDFNIFKMS